MMANENEIIPVLREDEDDSDLEEVLDLIADDDKGIPEKPTLEEQLASFRQEWQLELGKVTQESGGESQGSPAQRDSPALRVSPAPRLSPARRGVPAPRGSPVPRASPVLRANPAPGPGSRIDAVSMPVRRPEQKIDAVSTSVKSTEDTSNSRSPSPQSEDESDVEISSLLTESVEEKAEYLFKQGVKHERNGNMYEAVMFYRQALQLVPDVESRIQESEGNSYSGSNQVSDDEENNNEVKDMTNNNNCEMEEMIDNTVDDINALTIKLQLMTTNDLRTPCSTKTPQTATHISTLPIEVLLYIFRWVVTSNLDLRSLEQLSMVCRGFYVCSRDSEIWRKACVRMWGKMSYLMKEYVSWRDMFIHRAHPHFNGIYISRVTYIRQGEPSMDPFYKPWHLVEYHRFLRVFADGTIMLVSSSDDPQSVVSKMHKNYFIPGRMIGRFCIVGDRLTAVLEKEKVKEIDTGRRYMRHRTAQQNLPESEQTFHLELALTSFGRKPNMKLEWKRYACHTRYRSTGNENTTEFDMNHQFYPFYFSRVKSYARTADSPL